MAFAGGVPGNITVDGDATVSLTIFGGSDPTHDIGMLANGSVKANQKGIPRDCTTGIPVVGFNHEMLWDWAETMPSNITDMLAALTLQKVVIKGTRRTYTATASTAGPLFLSMDVMGDFDADKATSKIACKVEKRGQPTSTLASFWTVTS